MRGLFDEVETYRGHPGSMVKARLALIEHALTALRDDSFATLWRLREARSKQGATWDLFNAIKAAAAFFRAETDRKRTFYAQAAPLFMNGFLLAVGKITTAQHDEYETGQAWKRNAKLLRDDAQIDAMLEHKAAVGTGKEVDSAKYRAMAWAGMCSGLTFEQIRRRTAGMRLGPAKNLGKNSVKE